VMKEVTCRDPKMMAYCQAVRKLKEKFVGLELHHLPKHDNDDADKLTKTGVTRGLVPPGIFANDLNGPSVKVRPNLDQADDAADLAKLPHSTPERPSDASSNQGGSDAAVMMVDPDWMCPYLDYIPRDILPADKTEARCLARRAESFLVVGNDLYK
jgi:hypothetical protein